MVSDNPDQRIPLKMFHAEFVQDTQKLTKEQADYKQLPSSKVDGKMILDTYLQIKRDIKNLVENEMDRLMNDPELVGLVIAK